MKLKLSLAEEVNSWSSLTNLPAADQGGTLACALTALSAAGAVLALRATLWLLMKGGGDAAGSF